MDVLVGSLGKFAENVPAREAVVLEGTDVPWSSAVRVPRFQIRTLMIVIAVAGVACAYPEATVNILYMVIVVVTYMILMASLAALATALYLLTFALMAFVSRRSRRNRLTRTDAAVPPLSRDWTSPCDSDSRPGG